MPCLIWFIDPSKRDDRDVVVLTEIDCLLRDCFCAGFGELEHAIEAKEFPRHATCLNHPVRNESQRILRLQSKVAFLVLAR